LISTGFVSDRIIATGSEDTEVVISATSSASVVATAALLGSGVPITSPVTVQVGGKEYFHLGATFTFDAVPVPPTFAFGSRDFVDCEAVACAGLPTGFYTVRSVVRYCDNDAQGGGWLRLWRANDSACESNGWSSARYINANGSDPFGCSPAVKLAARCSNSTAILSPFAIGELRGTNWRVWGVGSLRAFHSRALCDGVVLWDAESTDTVVWALAASGSLSSGRCPCDSGFVPTNFTTTNLDAIGPHWSCAHLPIMASSWSAVSDFETNGSCTGASGGDVTMFQRAFQVPLRMLSVGLCKNGNSSFQDIKLAGGDLFVRATVGFDKREHCDSPNSSSAHPTLTTTSGGSIGTTNSVGRMDMSSIDSRTAPSSSPRSMQAAPAFVPSNSAPLIAGIAGGIAVVLVLLVVVVVGVAVVRRCRRDVPLDRPTVSDIIAARPTPNNYQVMPAAVPMSAANVYDASLLLASLPPMQYDSPDVLAANENNTSKRRVIGTDYAEFPCL
jgi:hypothetical protein